MEIPIRVWLPSVEHNDKHDYVKLILGSMTNARPVFFFPEDKGYSRAKSMLKWTKLFPGVAMPDSVSKMVQLLSMLQTQNIGNNAVFKKTDGKYYELIKITKPEQKD